jgi:hypothetical protein
MSEAFLKITIFSVLAATVLTTIVAIAKPEFREIAPIMVPMLVLPTTLGAFLMESLSEDTEINEVSRLLLKKFKTEEEKRYLEECLKNESDRASGENA